MAARKSAAEASAAGAGERLLVEAAQRDPAKFGDLYELHFERVYAYVTRRAPDRATAEDVTSEVFHKALANLPNYEWRGTPFVAWLFTIAANALADQAKRAARELPTADAPETGAEPCSESGVESELQAVEDGARLFRLVNQLPGDQRHVVIGRFVEQRS